MLAAAVTVRPGVRWILAQTEVAAALAYLKVTMVTSPGGPTSMHRRM
jgi:hypothetical protein